jgi:hypothetical protein
VCHSVVTHFCVCVTHLCVCVTHLCVCVTHMCVCVTHMCVIHPLGTQFVELSSSIVSYIVLFITSIYIRHWIRYCSLMRLYPIESIFNRLNWLYSINWLNQIECIRLNTIDSIEYNTIQLNTIDSIEYNTIDSIEYNCIQLNTIDSIEYNWFNWFDLNRISNDSTMIFYTKWFDFIWFLPIPSNSNWLESFLYIILPIFPTCRSNFVPSLLFCFREEIVKFSPLISQFRRGCLIRVLSASGYDPSGHTARYIFGLIYSLPTTELLTNRINSASTQTPHS